MPPPPPPPSSSPLALEVEVGCNRWPLAIFLLVYPGANLIAPSLCIIALLRNRLRGIKRAASFLALSMVNMAACVAVVGSYSDFINVRDAVPLPLLALACKVATLHLINYYCGWLMAARTTAGWNGISTTVESAEFFSSRRG